MVRLKVEDGNIWLPEDEYFNSNMVRLKEERKSTNINRQTYFNSNMVRLKATAQGTQTVVLQVFQFQYGAIKSLNAPSSR